MTPRERVLTALAHEEPDRVPIDLGGNQTGIHKGAYADLLQHLGIEHDFEIMDPIQQLARPCEEVLERFHVDTRYVAAGAASGWWDRREREGWAALARPDRRVRRDVVDA
jgi:uroporphyrinogen decarboxylase